MSLPVILRPEADADVEATYHELELVQAGLGSRFVARAREVLERIEATPKLYGVVWQDVRAVRLREFQHVVYYVVFDDRVERMDNMNEPAAAVTVDLRIPGRWAHPGELMERLPEGCSLSDEGLRLPDGTRVECGAMPADDQFAQIFRSACRQPATEDELATVDGYTVNVLLSGPGGSMQAARTMMRAAAAIIRAGGAGVFIDNSTVAHGGSDWLEMTEDGGPDALSYAFVAIIRGQTDVWTVGMHVLGLRDVVMKRVDVEQGGFDIVEVIRYLSASEKPIDDGHILADLEGPRFQAFAEASAEDLKGSPIHNPFGRLKLVSMRDIAETN